MDRKPIFQGLSLRRFQSDSKPKLGKKKLNTQKHGEGLLFETRVRGEKCLKKKKIKTNLTLEFLPKNKSCRTTKKEDSALSEYQLIYSKSKEKK